MATFSFKGFENFMVLAYLCTMKSYIFSLLALLSVQAVAQDYSKLSSYVRQLAHERVQQAETRAQKSLDPSPRMVMLVRGEESVLAPYCLTHQGDLYLCSLSVDEAVALSVSDKVSRIQATPAQMTANLDTLTKITHVDQVWQGTRLPQAYTGKGVLIGVPDIGIDYKHPAFRDDTDGHLRIVRAWDKVDLTQDASFHKGSNFPMGVLYTSPEAILAKGQSIDSYLATHGTQTTSVAAGSAAGTPYRGVAYEADIYSVCEKVSNNQDAVDVLYRSYYTDEDKLLSYSNIFAYADSVGQPCVINYSIGGKQDMTDEDLFINKYLERLLTPGHLLVASAGNDGKEAHYMYKPEDVTSVGSGLYSTKVQSTINVSTTGTLTMRLTNWSAATPVTHDVVLDLVPGDSISASGLKWYDYSKTDTLPDLYDMRVQVYSGYDGFDSTRVGYDIFLDYPNKHLNKSEKCTVEFIGEKVDARIFVQDGEFIEFKNDTVEMNDAAPSLGSLNSPGALPAVITVGSTSHRIDWTRLNGSHGVYDYPDPHGDRAIFSSCGPSLHGFTKPDVVAPGVSVASALNSMYVQENLKSVVNSIVYSGLSDGNTSYQWGVNCGTSFSAPVVAGILALWLQADPTLTQDRVKEIFAKTCRQEDSMLTLKTSLPGVWPNNECGYGEIDAYAGLLEILGLTSIPELSTRQLQRVSVVAAANGQIVLSADEAPSHALSCRVYAVSGQLLAEGRLQTGEQEITLQLPAYTGVVAVQVEGMGSTLIRME